MNCSYGSDHTRCVCVAAAAASGAPKPPAADATTKGMREYKPVEDACWVAGEAAPYMHLAQALAVRL